jgi:hypothetical protein
VQRPHHVTSGPAVTRSEPQVDQDDPFLSSGTQTPSASLSGAPAQPQAANQESFESFDLAVSSSSSDSDHDVTPQQVQQGARTRRRAMDPNPPTPTRHQKHAEPKALGPPGNKKGRLAADTHTFFEEQDGKRVCKFCLYVTLKFYLIHTDIGLGL